MDRVTIFDKSIPEMNLYFRKFTEGEELELVNSFIEYYVTLFEKNSGVKNLAVFIEPRIESGFPDIVFAKYRADIMENWNEPRNKLVTYDLKILSQLIYSRGCSYEYLTKILKLHDEQTAESLERLLDANMVTKKENIWRSRKLKDIYSIEELITVEAKIGDVRKVLEQSIRNYWFASQSYALINSNQPQGRTVADMKNYGVGLYCKKKEFTKIIDARNSSLPSSYLSLQFNEWIGRAII